MSFQNYLSVTKPGIIFGNAVTACAGFALASKGPFDYGLFCAALLGLSLIIASGCVWNNYFDREMDEKMERTRDRALVQGSISPTSALIFSLLLGLLGALTLGLFTNLTTLLTALFGLFFYGIVYGLSKYRTVYGTLIGSIAGAVPPLVGYFAVTPILDTGACLLFLITALWQMPHFYAIAIYRLDDYARASIPVLPLVKGVRTTKIHMLLYAAAFAIATLLLSLSGLLGLAFLIVASIVSAIWFVLCLKGFSCTDDKTWAKGVFLFSLIVICSLSLTIVLDRALGA